MPARDDEMGRNTKLSLLVNLALSMKLVCGKEHDSKSAIDTLRGFVQGNFVLTDKAYDTNAVRQYMSRHAVASL